MVFPFLKLILAQTKSLREMLCLIVTKRRQSCRIKTRGKVSALFIWMQFDLPSFQLENQKKGVAMFHKNTPLKRPKITLGVFQLVERDDASSYFQPPIKKFYARFFALNKWWGKASNVLNINPWRIFKMQSNAQYLKIIKNVVFAIFNFGIFHQYLSYWNWPVW